MSQERVLLGQYIGKSKSGGNYRHIRVDGSTETIQVIDYEHHEIHGGSHYFLSGVNDLSINEVYDVQFTTPDTTKEIHFTFSLETEAETAWYIYEGVTVNVAGTAMTPLNNDRNSTNTSVATVAEILNTSVSNANADTVVSGATLLESGISGAKSQSLGSETRDKELILKRNTVYCLRAIANAAGYIDFYMSWYEHTPKN